MPEIDNADRAGAIEKELPPFAIDGDAATVATWPPLVVPELPPSAVDIFRPVGREQTQGILTGREKEVLELRAMGKSNKEISQELDRPYATVKNQIVSILNRLGSNTCSQAIVEAVGLGVIDTSKLVPEDYDFPKLSELTPRQRETLVNLTNGEGPALYKEIASSMDISEQTVKNHMVDILKILGIQKKEQAVTILLEAVRIKQVKAKVRGEDPRLVNPFDWPTGKDEPISIYDTEKVV